MNLPHDRQGAASPQEWLKHASSDLKMARLAMNSDILPEQICFHAQQAAEKSLKAVLLHIGADFPFTHDIGELIEIAQRAGVVVPAELLELDALTPYAVQARHPGFWGEITDSDLAEAIEMAQKVVNWATAEVGAMPEIKSE
jgi:HEPN domain-containing protein